MVEHAERPPRVGVPFQVDVHPERDRVRVVPVGELDVATTAQLEAEPHELREAGFARIVLDLSQLESSDRLACASFRWTGSVLKARPRCRPGWG